MSNVPNLFTVPLHVVEDHQALGGAGYIIGGISG
jgi:hypothetical protein